MALNAAREPGEIRPVRAVERDEIIVFATNSLRGDGNAQRCPRYEQTQMPALSEVSPASPQPAAQYPQAPPQSGTQTTTYAGGP